MEGGATSSGYGAVTRPVEKPARKSALPAILAGCLALSMCAAVAFQHVDVPRAGSSALQEAVAYTPVTECSMTQEILRNCSGQEYPLLGGIDVVSYFTGDGPTAGDPMLMTEYQGNRLHFSSEQNLNQFLKEPEYYMPKGGGYCALALSGLDPNLETCAGLSPVEPSAYEVRRGAGGLAADPTAGLYLYRSPGAKSVMEELAASYGREAYDIVLNSWAFIVRGDVYSGDMMNNNNYECQVAYGTAGATGVPPSHMMLGATLAHPR